MRKSMVVYESFYQLLKEMKPLDAHATFMAMFEYGLYEKEPDNLKGISSGAFSVMKPLIAANNKKYENGKKGGRPKNQNVTTGYENSMGINNQSITTGFKNEPEIGNQTVTEMQPNDKCIMLNDNDKEIPPISPMERFEEFFSLYPDSKFGKPRNDTEHAYIDALSMGLVTELELVSAAVNYAEFCRITGTFVKRSDNFLKNCFFEQYLPYNYKKPKEKAGKFGDFEQHSYDFEELERNILSN